MQRAIHLSTLLALVLHAALLAEEPAPPHLEKARQIVQDLKPEHNLYAHKDIFVRWKGGPVLQYENRSDCSGFVNLLLCHQYNYSAGDLAHWFGRKRPLAKTYYDTIAAKKGFAVVARVQEIQPGDVLAVKYPPGGENTGHVMLAAGKAEQLKARPPLIDGAQQWQLEIIDSSKSPHGTKDTRRLPDGTDDTGLGCGTLRLYADKDGALLGYSWSTSSKSEFHGKDTRPIIVGRLIKDYKPAAAAVPVPDDNAESD